MKYFSLVFLLMIGQAFASEHALDSARVGDMKYAGAEVVPDCNYPSVKEPVYDKDGNLTGYSIKQDSRCDE